MKYQKMLEEDSSLDRRYWTITREKRKEKREMRKEKRKHWKLKDDAKQRGKKEAKFADQARGQAIRQNT